MRASYGFRMNPPSGRGGAPTAIDRWVLTDTQHLPIEQEGTKIPPDWAGEQLWSRRFQLTPARRWRQTLVRSSLFGCKCLEFAH